MIEEVQRRLLGESVSNTNTSINTNTNSNNESTIDWSQILSTLSPVLTLLILVLIIKFFGRELIGRFRGL